MKVTDKAAARIFAVGFTSSLVSAGMAFAYSAFEWKIPALSIFGLVASVSSFAFTSVLFRGWFASSGQKLPQQGQEPLGIDNVDGLYGKDPKMVGMYQ